MNIFIINPKAGNKKALELIPFLKEVENSLIYITKGPKDATEFSSYVTKIYPNSIIYSIGGDGTLNEVVNGITNTNSKLHIVPFGSGNDYYRIIKDILEQPVDIGDVNGHKFINISSFGVDAEIVNKVNQDNLQFLKYQRNILKTLLNYQKKNIKINNKQSLINVLAICKGKYYGNGIPINPNYDLNNSLFNILEASNLNTLQIIKIFFHIFKGDHLEQKGVNFLKANNIKIESKEPIYCNIDGEVITGTSFDFNLIPNGITITNQIPEKVKKIIYTK